MNKYITCYDVETTGLNPKEDFIIQLAMVKFEKDTFEQVKSANYYIKPAHKYNIDPKAQEVHGITKEFLEENGVFLKDIIEDIKDFFKDSDLLTYNGNNFDIKFLYKDLLMWGYELELDNKMFYDSFGMECRFAPRNLSAVYTKYTGLTIEDAHNAFADVNATITVFKHQLQHHKLTYTDIDQYNENLLISPDGTIRNAAPPGEPLKIVFAIGKYKDSEFMEVLNNDPGYVQWFKENVASPYTMKKLREYYKANRV
jgi:DNA polymerase-3 subunit epsilon